MMIESNMAGELAMTALPSHHLRGNADCRELGQAVLDRLELVLTRGLHPLVIGQMPAKPPTLDLSQLFASVVLLQTLDLDAVFPQHIANLARRQSKQACRLCLHPATSFHGRDDTLAVDDPRTI